MLLSSTYCLALAQLALGASTIPGMRAAEAFPRLKLELCDGPLRIHSGESIARPEGCIGENGAPVTGNPERGNSNLFQPGRCINVLVGTIDGYRGLIIVDKASTWGIYQLDARSRYCGLNEKGTFVCTFEKPPVDSKLELEYIAGNYFGSVQARLNHNREFLMEEGALISYQGDKRSYHISCTELGHDRNAAYELSLQAEDDGKRIVYPA